MSRLTRFVARTFSRLTWGVSTIALIAGLMIAGILLSIGAVKQAGTSLEFRAVTPHDPTITHEAALRLLEESPNTVSELATGRSGDTVWVLSDVHPFQSVSRTFFFAPSRHAMRISAWVLDSDGAVVATGSAVRGQGTSGMIASLAGFAIEIPSYVQNARVLMAIQSRGPARISIELWTAAALDAENGRFQEIGGVLFGSLLMIAAFSAVMAILARSPVFILFSAWIIASLRYASYVGGWDLAWLGLGEFEEYRTLAINTPLGIYAFLTVMLFRSLFKRDIVAVNSTMVVRWLTIASGVLLVAAPVVPHEHFLPLLWGIVGPGLLILAGLTLRIILRVGSSAAAWYGASWLVTFAGSGLEVAFASGLFPVRSLLFNSTTASVFSALLTAIALGERLKTEKVTRMRAQAQSLAVLRKLRENYDSMPIGLFSLGPKGEITLSNPAFDAMFPVSASDGGSRTIDSLLGAGTASRLKREGIIASDAGVELSTCLSNGEHKWFAVRVTTRDASIEGSIQDITVRKAAEHQLKRLVDHDHLTGLLNRRGLEVVLGRALESARQGKPCALTYIDLDHFKLVNDLHGHGTGDALLQQAARRIAGVARKGDSVARIGDSFIVVHIDCPDYAMEAVTERIRLAIADRPFEPGNKTLSMTASLGIIPLSHAASQVEAIAVADRACSEAKARGRNCVVRLTEKDAMLRSHLQDLKVVADLHRKIPADRYFLEFQPIIALASPQGSLNYEVLIRMRGEEGEVIPPSVFIGAAERHGLMSQIDRWVLRSILEWLDDHPAHRDKLTFATINLSGASLNDIRFVDDAFAMIAEHPRSMQKLCFEITESVALHDLASTRRFVDRVRMYGAKLALDDFGAGYTSFNYLKEIPADFVKIDGSFVRTINQNPANYAITRMIVDLSHELGMRSIAEWAETADTIESLVKLGVDFGQGFGLVRPVGPELMALAESSGALIPDARIRTMLEQRISVTDSRLRPRISSRAPSM